MRIFFISCEIDGFQDGYGQSNVLFLCRKGSSPRLFMTHADINFTNNQYNALTVSGDLAFGESFMDLQDGDHLIIYTSVSHNRFDPFYMDMYATEDMLVPFECEEQTVLTIASGMEQNPPVYIMTKKIESMMSQAKAICKRSRVLYAEQPAYRNIMLKGHDGINVVSLVKLASMQPIEKRDGLIAMLMSMSEHGSGNRILRNGSSDVPKRVLEQCEFDESFSLLTQEEQVESFIDFSRIIAEQKEEYVPDALIDQIEGSPEYQRVLKDLEKNGLGISETQQFNVFQQVGYFSHNRTTNIMYNLSDMGAGKTLMTVESIYLLDLAQITAWNGMKDSANENIEIKGVRVPDKHIIAPTLSIKSSWIDTFRLFYDVTEIDEKTYELSMAYGDVTAASTIYVSSFTVKDGKTFVKDKLPSAYSGTYLIIDEIHQLVKRNIAKTKFFQPKTVPVDIYKIFILSGTMSNMKAAEWLNFKKFMGMPVTSLTVQEAEKEAEEQCSKYRRGVQNASKNLRSEAHRYFDAEPITKETYYVHNSKKQTAYEKYFFNKYGSIVIQPQFWGEDSETVEGLLTEDGVAYSMVTDPELTDAINFELFYELVGSRAVTAQSVQVAEELFGDQKTQHVSDIIKTISPLSKGDIQLLKTLHHIAEDHNQYKSQTIAKAINNAILNLNDGLQTKNIYDIVSGYAEKNDRFFQYLSTLDVNILEQLPLSGLIEMPDLKETDKFKVLQDILQREKDDTHLIVVNDFHALKALSEALGIDHLTKDQLKRELDYQEILDGLFEKQSIVIVTQDMIKSSLDLVQANRLIQYQLNTEISDIIQTQNRINRIGQKRETRGYYIASDQLQENLIELFLESYRNIRVAHKGIVELFTDITSQINVVNDYLNRAFIAIEENDTDEPAELEETKAPETHLTHKNPVPDGAGIVNEGGIARAILYPQNGQITVLVPLVSGNAFPLGNLKPDTLEVTAPTQVMWNLETDRIEH